MLSGCGFLTQGQEIPSLTVYRAIKRELKKGKINWMLQPERKESDGSVEIRDLEIERL
jgi:hypothetical protein